MKRTLLLGSQSKPRQQLLNEANIPFTLVVQDADERACCDWGLPLVQLVQSIALHKMESLELPEGKGDGEHCFILTADTLSQDMSGEVQGKPSDYDDAVKKIRSAREGDGSRLCTGFCLERRVWRGNEWVLDERIQREVEARYQFEIPDEWIDTYLKNSIALSCSNAIAIDYFGMQFLKDISGSYSTIIGLPMFELREALEKVGFFK